MQAQLDADGLSSVHVLRGDLTDAASLTTAAKQISSITDSIDYLVVNGAYMNDETMFLAPSGYAGKETFFVEELTKSMITNVAGVLFAINALIPLVKKSEVKKVAVISTGLAAADFFEVASVAGAIPYSISKAAVNLLVQKYAIEYKNEGIIFLALSPGLVASSVEDLSESKCSSPYDKIQSQDGNVELTRHSTVPPEQTAVYRSMSEVFRKYEPSFVGPILSKESVEMQLKVIHTVTLEDSGAFLSHHGNKRWL